MSQVPKLYRLHIDEVGVHDMGPAVHRNERYLSLTGVIVSHEHCQTSVAQELESLKDVIRVDSTVPLILHRREIVARKPPPFDRLTIDRVRYQFNSQLIRMLNTLEYTVITILIDKRAHIERYRAWQWPPYHYCFVALLERYLTFLGRRSARGDVMIEGRGRTEDKRLKGAFKHAWNHGTDYVAAAVFQSRLTSRELKIKSKTANDPGLQLADLLASPSHYSMLVDYEHIAPPERRPFREHIVDVLKLSKYDRNNRGIIDGCGRKWLPVPPKGKGGP